MKEYWNKFKEWYSRLEQREQRMVSIGGVALAAAILYFGIWSPFLGRVDNLRTTIAGEQKTLAWMKDAEDKIKQLSSENNAERKSVTPVALLSELQDAVNQAGMKDALTQMKQASNESVHMEFKNVSFDQLMKLMINVLKANQVNITQFNANALATPGMVNADIIINIA